MNRRIPIEELSEEGIALRDRFAGQALKGFCSNNEKHKRAIDHSHILGGAKGSTIAEIFAKEAYSYADAMLAERER